MKIMLSLLFLFAPILIQCQENSLSIFDNLVGKTWKAEGEWGNGSSFKQELEIEYSLDKSIVQIEAKGFVDEKQTTFGHRNHGIRQYDTNCKCIRFWEYDVFGGLTEGVVIQEGKNILYQYEYGDLTLTDKWEYVDDHHYIYTIGEYSDGKWKSIYLNSRFIADEKSDKEKALKLMSQNLNGFWTSPAWSGQLNETWSTNEEGQIEQKAQYFEDGKITYEASNKIEIVNDELVLFTVIKDNNPKIFKATTFSENEIVFENSDYSNPNKVVYTFFPDDRFERTISGLEKGKPTSYTFKFSKQE